ncbi:serine/threonine-protein kinase [Accumulibacter sp.]|uniref:serine/threonine-protein kinase n=1 Tax=Accumulibacter sp. TaxID=2053492 RepID=UPI0026255023|nr:serine/threonine-protein kinase [Accumulibacter sp.]
MQKIGKYELVREIGRGATSTVYLGRDPFTQRNVAVKVASPDILKDAKRRRLYTHLFLNEAALIGKLLHPHIVQTYDAVVDDQLCYIVMEYVAGGTLETVCAADRLLPIERIVEIVFKCTRALEFAFQAGIIHRDIKPANILLTSADPNQGDIKLSDFGAAIIGSPDRTLVLGIGSPAYMSPQQVKEQTLDHQTDIYSLGVVMYQLLTGHLPFQGRNSYDMIYQIINGEFRRPSTLRSGIPEVLDKIVARAMSKKLHQRYRSWQEFAHDLAQAFRDRQLKVASDRMPDLEKFDTLRSFPFFADFSDVEIWEVVRFSEWTCVEPDTVVIRDGEPGDCFYFLAEGELKVLKNGMVLELLANGDCFGEMAVIGKEKSIRGADIVTLTRAKLARITGNALKTSSESCRFHFYQAFLAVLSERLTSANLRLVSF